MFLNLILILRQLKKLKLKSFNKYKDRIVARATIIQQRLSQKQQ